MMNRVRSAVPGFDLYVAQACSAVMYLMIGASVPLIFAGWHALAVVLLFAALMCWPWRLKFQITRLKADSFEDAMRQIAEMRKREGQ